MSTPPFPSPTKTWHNDTYADIDPAKPKLSAKGKRVVITGGGTGIGAATAKSFAAAGAESIVLLGGRRENLLKETKDQLEKDFSNVKIDCHAVDITDLEVVRKAAKDIGEWDVLVLNAAYLPAPGLLGNSDLDDQAMGWAVAVQGNVQVIYSLLPQHKPNSAVVAVSTGAVSFPGNMLQGNAVYMALKTGLAKLMEIMSAEVPDCRWVTLHPGAVETDMFEKSGFRGAVPMDSVALAANFTLWLTSPEAAFLNGRFAWSNWDVNELKARADEIQNSPMLTMNIVGWPFS